MDRRNFLRLYGEGLADAVLLGTAGGRVLAQTAGPSLNTQFEATTDYDVPKKLPLTIGYANTSWEIPPPSASSYDQDDLHGRRAHGIIQLVQKPFKDTLDRASLLTGLSKKQLKNDRRLGDNHIIGHHEVPRFPGASGRVKCHTDHGRYQD